ncbi:hypothetical protein ABEB36_012226 [Hypothenemus hampei]|uniref:Chromatin complexes subunit BAP18 n=1 Tax=Hypothenemus hampei TaxID=57062 RepID=A0ABD1EAH2_HYPHA
MSSASKVGEIFTAAGQAFNRLGDLTMQLHPHSESPTGTALKKKAFEDAGLPVRQVNPTSQTAVTQPSLLKQEVTLNMLNAAESEVDVEGLPDDVKLEFDGSNEEVST